MMNPSDAMIDPRRPPRCQCEHAACDSHYFAAGGKRVETVYGAVLVCDACWEQHPIPDEYLK